MPPRRSTRGKIDVTTAGGTANGLTGMSFTAVTSANAALPNFNALAGAASTTVTPATNGGVQAGGDTLQITKGGTTTNVALAAGDQLTDIVAKINATSGAGVIASIVSGKIQPEVERCGGGRILLGGQHREHRGVPQLRGDAGRAGRDLLRQRLEHDELEQQQHHHRHRRRDAELLRPDEHHGHGRTGQLPSATPQDQWITSVSPRCTPSPTPTTRSLDFVQQKTQGESQGGRTPRR